MNTVWCCELSCVSASAWIPISLFITGIRRNLPCHQGKRFAIFALSGRRTTSPVRVFKLGEKKDTGAADLSLLLVIDRCIRLELIKHQIF